MGFSVTGKAQVAVVAGPPLDAPTTALCLLSSPGLSGLALPGLVPDPLPGLF